MRSRSVYRIALLVGLLCLVGAGVQAASARMGEVVAIGDGYARTYVTVDSAGTPMSLGIVFTEGALTGLPEMFREYTLPLPAQVSVPPFDHAAVDWNPQGHIPPGIYDVPHFDFHFYMMTPAERDRITVTGEDLARVERRPEPEFMPRGYMWTPGGEPRMGAHYVPTDAPEFHGGQFGETFIYGFYDGRMVFVEPMVTLAYLQARPNLYASLRLPARYPEPGYYPTSYAVVYDPRMQRYVVALTGLARR